MLHALVREARARLVSAGIANEEAAMDAELLAREALGWDRPMFLARLMEEPPAGFEDRFQPLIERRARREPVAYICGAQEFWGRDFIVGPGVLIPRPETEFIIERALAWNGTRPAGATARVLDIGTGSGCLAITLALELPGARVAATDISREALDIARANQSRWGTAVTFHEGPFLASADVPVDLLVSNPPYVTAADFAGLQPEVQIFEPITALVSGADGLDAVREIVPIAARALAPGGLFLMEIGFGQADAVQRVIASTAGLRFMGFAEDLQGIPRVAQAVPAGR